MDIDQLKQIEDKTTWGRFFKNWFDHWPFFPVLRVWNVLSLFLLNLILFG